MGYNSMNDTLVHIRVVQKHLSVVIQELLERAFRHDGSKLQSPEKDVFDRFTPLLRNTTYGSDEYRQFLEGMGIGLSPQLHQIFLNTAFVLGW